MKIQHKLNFPNVHIVKLQSEIVIDFKIQLKILLNKSIK